MSFYLGNSDLANDIFLFYLLSPSLAVREKRKWAEAFQKVQLDMLPIFLSTICWYSDNIKVHGVPCTGMWFRVVVLFSFWNVLHPSLITNFMCQFHQGAPTHPRPQGGSVLAQSCGDLYLAQHPTPYAGTAHQSH